MARRKHWTTVVQVGSDWLVSCDCGQLEELLDRATNTKTAAITLAKDHQVAAEYSDRLLARVTTESEEA